MNIFNGTECLSTACAKKVNASWHYVYNPTVPERTENLSENIIILLIRFKNDSRKTFS
jgi:hypothetical protein